MLDRFGRTAFNRVEKIGMTLLSSACCRYDEVAVLEGIVGVVILGNEIDFEGRSDIVTGRRVNSAYDLRFFHTRAGNARTHGIQTEARP